MSTFFQQTAQAMIAKHIDCFPLLIQNPQLVQTENVFTPNQQQNTEPQINIVNQEAVENQPYTESKTSFAGQSSDVVSEQKIKNLSTKLKMEEVLNVMSEEELQELATN